MTQYGSIQIEQGTGTSGSVQQNEDESTIRIRSRKCYHVKYVMFATVLFVMGSLLIFATTSGDNLDWFNKVSSSTAATAPAAAAAASSSSPFLPTNKSLWPFLRVRPSKHLKKKFTGTYSDPNHVNCLREILHVGQHAYLYGTDGNPDCPPDGSGDQWELSGYINGQHIYVDFSPKGGPKDLAGVWEKSPIPGIRWPDGNLWAFQSDKIEFDE